MPDVMVIYSENLPGHEKEFKSRRFQCELSEKNVPANAVKSCTEKLFQVAKEQVKSEIGHHPAGNH